MSTDDLIQRYIEGTATPEDAGELSKLIETDTVVAGRYLDLAELHAALIGDDLLRMPLSPALRGIGTDGENNRSPQRPRWRPLVAAAAGLMIGAFSASLVFAFGVPRSAPVFQRLPSLVDGGFEQYQGSTNKGFPSAFGTWSGDPAEVSAGLSKEGVQRLRFIRAEGDDAVPQSPANSCDIYQLVDLRPLRQSTSEGEVTLEMSAQFLDERTERGSALYFSVRLYVFSGSPESLRSEWPLTRKDALASGSGAIQSNGGSPSTWNVVRARVLLPQDADFAVVQLVAGRPASGTPKPAEFGEQFVDDVRLVLKTQPGQPFRAAD